MNRGQNRVWQELVDDGLADKIAGNLGLTWCDHCEDYTEAGSKVVTGTRGPYGETVEPDDQLEFCTDCGRAL